MLSSEYIALREHVNLSERHISGMDLSQTSRILPCILNERSIALGETDKVFAAEWLSEQYVMFGTKCNKLLAADVDSGRLFSIPLVRNGETQTSSNSCGIHSIAVSPASHYVSTCGQNPSEVAVYRNYTLDPLVLGQWHKDWIFSSCWVDRSFLVTGSRDSTMAMWSIPDTAYDHVCLAESVPSMEPLCTFSNISEPQPMDKVRDLAYSNQCNLLASLQSSQCTASVHFWDCHTCKQVSHCPMEYGAENVCLSLDENKSLLAVGSRAHVTLLDPRLRGSSGTRLCRTLCSPDGGNGVRSVEFNEEVLSFGTGEGNVYFYDLRAGQYLSRQRSPPTGDQAKCSLRISKGYLRHDDIYRDFFHHVVDLRHAIYTHRYNPSGTKLFVAGGPLPLGLYGSYAAFWQ